MSEQGAWRERCGNGARAIAEADDGEPSSVRTKLAATDKALELALVHETLFILTDSLNTI